MSRNTSNWDDLSVQSVPDTIVVTPVHLPPQLANDEQLGSRRECEKWLLINYDRSEAKSAQELLFEAASEEDLKEYPKKWNLFMGVVVDEKISDSKLKKMISTLDDEKQWAALHYAVDCNNEELCRKLTSKKKKYSKCDINILGGNGENVLHVVSQSNCIWQGIGDGSITKFPDLIRFLVEERGADVNHADDEGRTPLHMAAMRGRLRYIKYLIHHGAKVDVLSKFNASVLHFAVFPVNPINAEQLYSLVEYITNEPLAKEKDFFNLCTLDNRTPLVFLAAHPAITRPSSIDQKEGQQIFKYALMKIFIDTTKDKTQILIVFDMVARRRQCQPFDHLEHLFEISSPEIKEQIIHLACRYDNVALLRWLINRPAPKGYTSKINCAEYTPLLTAIFYNSIACVQELIKNIDGEHQLPLLTVGAVEQDNILHICAKRQVSSDILNIIIGKLSDKNIKKLMETQDSNGNLPLHLVAQIYTKKELEIWKKLINENISLILDFLSIKNRRGTTVAHEASEQGNVHILELMWELIPPDDRYDRMKGLYVTTNNNRFTCLHIAAKNGGIKELEVLKYLIETVRIEVDAIGDRRLTPLHIACEFGHLDVVEYLIEKGASTTIRNAQLLNCLEICIQKQHVEIVKYLLQRSNWQEMMRNAQPIEGTDAYDTPMRKLIRYMPDVALWTIEEKLTRKVGGAGQKVSQEIYDYEFYEDMYTVKEWYKQGLAVGEIPTLMDEGTRWRNQMLYNFVSDGEILRLQFHRFIKFVCCCKYWNRKSRMSSQPVALLTFDQRAHGCCQKAWHYTKNHFFDEKIQDDIKLKITSNDDD
ncbi:unnamed protein product [Adineta steineri]|uniref:Uncharacterized protein n=1 Tax=Adineta steineri TaxID=433720 RepID=A0A813Z6V7_9BILA|nr:unnamed protein product [Adineta steineri]CAF0894290.1 unnamed protein product [Adineta steineri]